MKRLTQKEKSGNWKVNGLPWKEIQEGETITKETAQRLYGCLCKLKDYEDTGMNPDQLAKWWYELKDMAGHVCDDLCHYRRELTVQEELDKICERCSMSVCRKKLLDITE